MFNRSDIESGKQVVTLADLRDIVRNYEREQAPGSETYALTLFTDWRREKSDEDIIPADDVKWWMDYYEAQGSLDDLGDNTRDEVQNALDMGEPAQALEIIDTAHKGAENEEE